MKKFVAVLLALLCMVMTVFQVSAADDRLGMIVDGSLLTDEASTEGQIQSIAKGTNLIGGSGGLAIVSGRTLGINGSTSCYRTVDKVQVKLYLQRLEGNTWVTEAILGPRSAFNASYVSMSRNCTVSGGYYYRVQGAHTAILNGVAETGISYSNGIWVY